MVASLRNLSARGVKIGPVPAPPTPPLFLADFTTFSNGTMGGKAATDYNATYSSGTFGVWPSGAPLYSGDPWPTYWNGDTVSALTNSWYISSGKAYQDGTYMGEGLMLPLYVPLSIMNTGIRITAKFVPVGSPPSSPFDLLMPNLRLYAIRNIGGSFGNGELFYNTSTQFRDYSDLVWAGSDIYTVPELWDGVEHTIIWEMSAAGRLALTLDGNPLGNQTLEPWFSGYEPSYESYVAISTQYLSDGDTIGSFGYTYIKVEEL
jgi:hypothetical protein